MTYKIKRKLFIATLVFFYAALILCVLELALISTNSMFATLLKAFLTSYKFYLLIIEIVLLICLCVFYIIYLHKFLKNNLTTFGTKTKKQITLAILALLTFLVPGILLLIAFNKVETEPNTNLQHKPIKETIPKELAIQIKKIKWQKTRGYISKEVCEKEIIKVTKLYQQSIKNLNNDLLKEQ